MDYQKKKEKKFRGADHVLVYSSEPEKIKTDTPLKSVDNTGDRLVLASSRPAVRLEKKGRGGKSVTVIYRLSPVRDQLKSLCEYLKRELATGGTFKITPDEGLIEIQGDKCREVQTLIESYLKK